MDWILPHQPANAPGSAAQFTPSQAAMAKAPAAARYAEYKRLIAYAELREYKPGWAANAYRRTFGKWPVITDRALFDATPAADRPFFDPQKSQ